MWTIVSFVPGGKKPTRIWCCEQIAQLGNVLCNKNTCLNIEKGLNGGWQHKEPLGGKKLRLRQWEKQRMPPDLVDFLLSAPPLPPQRKPVGGGIFHSEWA